jgi:DNA-3-methyladenine glycosylase
MKKLQKNFFNSNTVNIAKELVGKFLVTNLEEGRVVGKIVETEAYMGIDDLACHASHGKTKRTEVLFGDPGRLYVYLNYGIFWLTNIIAHEKNYPGGILLRSAKIIEGKEIVIKRLEKSKFVKANEMLASGPGKLSIAFGLDGDFHNHNFIKSDKIYIEEREEQISPENIVAANRIGVEYAKHCKDYLWRFYLKDNKFVSKK